MPNVKMPKLILDDAATALALARLQGQPIFTGPNGEFVDLGVVAVLEDGDGHEWQPANKRTSTLILACEACRDLIDDAQRLIGDINTQKRSAKRMTVPLCTLMEKVAALSKVNEEPAFYEAQESWPKE